jgi:hypothetical protein
VREKQKKNYVMKNATDVTAQPEYSAGRIIVEGC